MVVKVGVGKTMVKQPFGYRKTLQLYPQSLTWNKERISP